MDSSNAAQLPFPSVTLSFENYVTDFLYNGQRCLVVRELNTVNDLLQDYKDYEIVVLQKTASVALPENILVFNNLKMLTISDCALQSLPDEIHFLQNLTLLDLAGNKLSDLPQSIAKLQQLKVLDLSRNKLVELPTGISSLPLLQTLDLSDNKIDNLSPTIGLLKGLQSLSCSSNLLTNLPDEIGCLKYLKILRLVNNKLCSLPKTFVDMKGLLMIQLDNNLFEHIPIQLFSCYSLLELSISHNNICGSLSSQIVKLKNLRTFNIAFNHFTEISREIGELSRIEYLNISDNPIKSILPSICKFGNLQELCISNCSMRKLPTDLVRCDTLVVLNASNNLISEFPESISKLNKLSSLCLSQNNIERLPAGLCRLQNLVVLELRSNRLSTLPREFGKLSSTLRQLDLSNNVFTDLPRTIFQSKSRLSYLNIDCNLISCIPDQIQHLQELTHFSASGCKNLNFVSDNLGACFNLRVLRLARNNLNKLPNTLENLKSLKYLDLSHNQFEKFPMVVCFIPRLRVLLYDQTDGRPLVTKEDPKTWYEKAKLLNPESESNKKPGPNNIHELNIADATLEQALEEEYAPGLPVYIARLSQLAHLSLQHNGLFFIPDVFHLMNLRRLNLGFNRIKFLPPNFHHSRFLTHLYLHNNNIETLEYSFCDIESLRILTLDNNPLVSPPRDLCSGFKAKPVFSFLKQRKIHEDFIIKSLCNLILNELPREITPQFLEKLGYSADAIESLEKEFPGGYNHTKRLQYALETWTGFPINSMSQLTRARQASNVLPYQEPSHQDSNDRSQSVHTTWIDPSGSEHSTSHFSLDKPIMDKPSSFQRLLHIVHLLDLEDLHKKLKQTVEQCCQLRF